MTRSSSSEPTKSGKRKATRSVSSLTPSQLARKRANDREAQRAIRQRTKEHIEQLERQVDNLKHQNHDEVVRDLMRENKQLQDELHHCRSELRRLNACSSSSYVHPPPHPSGTSSDWQQQHLYSWLVHSDSPRPDSLPGGPNVPSPVAGFRRHSPADQHSIPVSDYRSSFIPTPEPSIVDTWPNVGVPCSVASNVSSPTSTSNDDYGNYMPPTTVTPPFNASGLPPTSVPMMKRDVGEYEEMEAAAAAAANHGHAYQRQATPHHGMQANYLPTGAQWPYPMYTTQ